MAAEDRKSLVMHMDVRVDLNVDRVRISISRADTPEVLDLLLTGSEAWSVARRLLTAAEQVTR